jgi:hypothetical protein
MNNQDNSVQLVTRRGLADRWQVSIETLKRRERCGILPVLKLGRGVRYRLDDVERIEADASIGRCVVKRAHTHTPTVMARDLQGERPPTPLPGVAYPRPRDEVSRRGGFISRKRAAQRFGGVQ